MIPFLTRQPPAVLLGFLFLVVAVEGVLAANLYLSGRLGDWHHFFYAADAVRLGDNPYGAHARGYLYPPLLAFLLQPLLPLGYETAGAVWVLLMAGVIALSAWFGFRIVAELTEDAKRAAWITLGVFLLVVEKMYSTLKNAQTDALILFCLVAGLYWIRRYPVAAGLAVAFAAAIKFHALLLILVFLIRGDHRALLASLAGFAVLLLVPAAQVGWDTNLLWLGQTFGGLLAMVQDVPMDRAGTGPLAAAAVAPITWERSVSLTSAFSRLGAAYPDLSSTAVGAGFLAVIGLCVAMVLRSYSDAGLNAFWRKSGTALSESAQRALRLCDWSLAVTIILVFSPQTTGRHYMLAFLPVLLMGIAASKELKDDGNRTVLYLMATIPLALYLPPSDLEALLGAWKAIGGLSWVFLAAMLIVLRRYLIRLDASAPTADRRDKRKAG
ncbi:MAG: DUF2029 domain-containing protein [Alphaproteobacteria bacterium]|nr:DUF2029 domain-containing protein [Alphaproteobacteria bacterium]